eukprot:scaffold645_cov247-Pinguiococcus_pyrenoidosus.AAC.12
MSLGLSTIDRTWFCPTLSSETKRVPTNAFGTEVSSSVACDSRRPRARLEVEGLRRGRQKRPEQHGVVSGQGRDIHDRVEHRDVAINVGGRAHGSGIRHGHQLIDIRVVIHKLHAQCVVRRGKVLWKGHLKGEIVLAELIQRKCRAVLEAALRHELDPWVTSEERSAIIAAEDGVVLPQLRAEEQDVVVGKAAKVHKRGHNAMPICAIVQRDHVHDHILYEDEALWVCSTGYVDQRAEVACVQNGLVDC